MDSDELACGSNPMDPSSKSPDFDSDGLLDCLDPDDDNDGILDVADNCPFQPNSDQANYDGDDRGDICDPDDDNDEVLDVDDPFPLSNTDPTVIINGCNSGVDNLNIEGASFSDLIGECAASATGNGQFVSCVAHLANEWSRAGLISGRDRSRIINASVGVNCRP